MIFPPDRERVEAAWKSCRQSAARHVDRALVEAAYAEPRLRALFPFHSHYSLNFSRRTEIPYTHDVPVITPARGRYRVTWWQTRSPHGPADIGEVDDPYDAVALVVANLPPDHGLPGTGTGP